MEHYLSLSIKYFSLIFSGKSCSLMQPIFNRGYLVGENVLIEEINPYTFFYTGRWINAEIVSVIELESMCLLAFNIIEICE